MPEYQKRVVEEEHELGEKLTKLGAFIGSPHFDGVALAERQRLIRQHAIMGLYRMVLIERIANF